MGRKPLYFYHCKDMNTCIADLPRLEVLDKLTPTELAVLKLYSTYGNHQHVAEILQMSVRTAQSHTLRLRNKLDLRFTTQAVILLLNTGFKPNVNPIGVTCLSPLNAKVLTLLKTTGGSNKELAKTLFIAPTTIDDCISQIFYQTGLTNRVQLITQSILYPDKFLRR